MKYLFLAVLSGISVYIGYIFSRKYKIRANFFQALVMLCQKFDVEINYSRERLKNIFLGLDEKQKKKLQGIDINFLSYINNETNFDRDSLFRNLRFLKEEEKDVIFMFFKN